jgi:hypothetical protein
LTWSGHTGLAAAFYGAFPDLQHRVEQVVVEGDQESIRFSLVGTHKGEFNGIPATGKQVEVSASAYFTIRDGRVAHLRGLIDQMGMMQQLGCDPNPQSPRSSTLFSITSVRRSVAIRVSQSMIITERFRTAVRGTTTSIARR